MNPRNILIGGVPNAGKSILSRRLVEQRGYSRLPGDPLVLAFQQVFPALGIAHTREGFRHSCAAFGRYVAALMDALPWESDMRYVLDSFYFRPADLGGIDQAKTRIFFLGYPEIDADSKLRSIQRHQAGWSPESRTPMAKLREVLPAFIEMSREDRTACADLGFEYTDTGADFAAALQAALHGIIGQAGPEETVT